MRQRIISRRIVFGIACALLISVVAFNRFYDRRDDHIARFDEESHIIRRRACRIWPDWNASDRGSLCYDDYNPRQAQLLSVGDVKVLGNADKCLKSKSRLDIYHKSSTENRDWNTVQWGHIQKRCAASNQHLYINEISADGTRNYDSWRQPPSPAQTSIQQKREGGRTAVVLRTWDNYDYTDARRAWLRALITETALHSDSHYEVLLLVNVKDNTIELEERQAAYEQALQAYVPEEFQDMAVLWNERTTEKWYPKVEEHGPQDQMYQALQIFSHQFPHFTHFWQLEMDIRFTGHIYDSLENAVAFAKSQPRRNLWERNGRFFFPDLQNGSYDTFTKAVDDELGDSGIWGPVVTTNFMPKGPKPPPRSEKDWGVDEDADVISLFPDIDPIGTDWIYESMIHGFTDGLATPRRASLVSMTRSSRRLLQLVSEAQRESGQWLASEATLETFALLHGLKAVTIPHRTESRLQTSGQSSNLLKISTVDHRIIRLADMRFRHRIRIMDLFRDLGVNQVIGLKTMMQTTSGVRILVGIVCRHSCYTLSKRNDFMFHSWSLSFKIDWRKVQECSPASRKWWCVRSPSPRT